MELKIKRIGNTRGTIGWLSAGITDGSIVIEEGRTKTEGYHGLWIEEYREGKRIWSEFLAGYNVFGAGPNVYDSWPEFDSDKMLTPAARRSLRAAAKEWIAEMNEALENEESIDIKLIRVEASPTAQSSQPQQNQL